MLAQLGIVRPANTENPKIKMFLEEFISVYCTEKFHTLPRIKLWITVVFMRHGGIQLLQSGVDPALVLLGHL